MCSKKTKYKDKMSAFIKYNTKYLKKGFIRTMHITLKYGRHIWFTLITPIYRASHG